MFDMKITHKSFSFYTSKQNEHFERKKNLIVMKTRILRIYVNLSIYLWSWIVCVVEFLINKISIKKHAWRIFFKFVINMKSIFFHFYKFEYKTYFFDKFIFKKKKLRKRTHIKHFLKYDDTNIFFIWISNQKKIIRTRNVTFDEFIFYNVNDFDVF